jgi:DNA-directed RNA polymerase subunit RPC12/RpoP
MKYFLDTDVKIGRYVECPKCSHRIPVRGDELVDYKLLHEEQEKYTKELKKNYDNLIKDMSNEIPEVKIYLHNKHVEIQQTIKKITRDYEKRTKNE